VTVAERIESSTRLAFKLAATYGGREGNPYRADLAGAALLALCRVASSYDGLSSHPPWGSYAATAILRALYAELVRLRSPVRLSSKARLADVPHVAVPQVFDDGERDPLDELPGDAPDPEVEAHRAAVAAAVRDAVSGLSDRDRTVVRLTYLHDGGDVLDHAAVARRLGLSRERVRVIHARALAQLREAPALRVFVP